MEEREHPIDPAVCKDRFKSMSESLISLNVKVDNIYKRLFESNGDSLVTRVAVLERGQEDIIEALKDDRKDRTKYSDMVASTFIKIAVSVVIGGAAALLLWERGVFGK